MQLLGFITFIVLMLIGGGLAIAFLYSTLHEWFSRRVTRRSLESVRESILDAARADIVAQMLVAAAKEQSPEGERVGIRWDEERLGVNPWRFIVLLNWLSFPADELGITDEYKKRLIESAAYLGYRLSVIDSFTFELQKYDR